jgi:hypothetical protein
MLRQPHDTKEDENEARLRVVRYYSDVNQELVPDEVREAHIARVRELEAMSDEELEKLGILREDIVDHVFQEAHFI